MEKDSKVRGTLNVEERAYLKTYLNFTKAEFLMTLQGLRTDQLHYRPEDKGWSIADCAEHIALSELSFFGLLQKQLERPPSPEIHDQISVSAMDIINRFSDRSKKNNAPDLVQPRSTFPEIAMTIDFFTNQRDRCLQYVETTQDNLHHRYWKHPSTGLIDLYLTIILMAAHSQRHILQMEAIKASLGFPA